MAVRTKQKVPPEGTIFSAHRNLIHNYTNRRAPSTHRGGTKFRHHAAQEHPECHSTVDPGRCPSGCSLAPLVSLCGVVIDEHTDDRGDDAMHLRLIQERCSRGMTKGLEVIDRAKPTVSPCFQQLTSARGRGRQDLIAHPATGVDRAKSRRVTFKLRLRSTPTPHTLPRTS